MALAQYVSSKESAFGGFHFEHVPAFTLVIQVAGSASASDVREAVSLIPGGAAFRVERVSTSLAELRQAQDAVVRIAKAERLAIAYATIDVAANVVVVGRPDGGSDDRLRASSSVVRFEFANPPDPLSCTRLDCSPVRGGVKISNSVGGQCTLGLSARSGTVHYLVTAGHCASGSEYWMQSGIMITSGTDRNSYSVSAASSDSLRAPYISSGRVQPPYNTIYLNSNTPAQAVVAKDNLPVVGEISCVSAWFYGNGYRCGTVAEDARWVPMPASGGFLWTLMVVTNISHNTTTPNATNPYGESSSPAFRSATFLGIVAAAVSSPGSSAGVLAYSKPSVIETDLLVTFCTTATC